LQLPRRVRFKDKATSSLAPAYSGRNGSIFHWPRQLRNRKGVEEHTLSTVVWRESLTPDQQEIACSGALPVHMRVRAVLPIARANPNIPGTHLCRCPRAISSLRQPKPTLPLKRQVAPGILCRQFRYRTIAARCCKIFHLDRI